MYHQKVIDLLIKREFALIRLMIVKGNLVHFGSVLDQTFLSVVIAILIMQILRSCYLSWSN